MTPLTNLPKFAAAVVLAGLQASTLSAQGLTRLARESIVQAQIAFRAGQEFETSHSRPGQSWDSREDLNRAIAAYSRAEQFLNTSLPTGLGMDSMGMFTPRTQYASAALLSSTIALDAARLLAYLGRTNTPEFYGFTATAHDDAFSLLNNEQSKGCVNAKSSGLDLPRQWEQPPVPGEQAKALMNLGRVQLMSHEIGLAKGCFRNVLRMDPLNSEAAQILRDVPDVCTFCITPSQKASIVAAAAIGNTLLQKRYPLGAPITATILGYVISLLPDRPVR